MLAGALSVLLSAPAVHAASFYDFIQTGTGAVLAQVALDGDQPWDHTAVSSLTFTEAGDAILGLGDGLYGGQFTMSVRAFIKDAAGDGLIGTQGLSASIFDVDPPDESDRVTLFANTEGNSDRIFVEGPARTAVGNWKFNPVPEPGSLGLAFMAMVGVAACRRRRQS